MTSLGEDDPEKGNPTNLVGIYADLTGNFPNSAIKLTSLALLFCIVM